MRRGQLALAVLTPLVVLAAGACKGDRRSTGPAGSSTTAAAGPASTALASTSATPAEAQSQPTPTTAKSTNVGGPPAALAAIPLPVPRLGSYMYHERLQPERGDRTERAIRFQLSAVKGKPSVVRWDEIDEKGALRATGDHYDLVHDRDGLHLLVSYTAGREECRWSPRSAMLPRAVIQGGNAETRSTCTVTINGKPTVLTLVTTLKFVRTHDAAIAGVTRRALDVSRVRVLSADVEGGYNVTSRAIDTYALDLGTRLRTEEHTTMQEGGRTRESTRTLTLTAVP